MPGQFEGFESSGMTSIRASDDQKWCLGYLRRWDRNGVSWFCRNV